MARTRLVPDSDQVSKISFLALGCRAFSRKCRARGAEIGRPGLIYRVFSFTISTPFGFLRRAPHSEVLAMPDFISRSSSIKSLG